MSGRAFFIGPPTTVHPDAGFADSLCDADEKPGGALAGIAGIAGGAGSPCDAAEAVDGCLPCDAARAVTPNPSGNIEYAGAVDAAGSPGSSCVP